MGVERGLKRFNGKVQRHAMIGEASGELEENPDEGDEM